MILPLVAVVVLLSGVLASLESAAAMTKIANRLLAFKAELLRDYFFSEWDVLSSLGLEEKREYRTAAEESFRSYAYSILRSPTELIAVFDSKDELVMEVQLKGAVQTPEGASAAARKPPALGWFNQELLGEPRVGVAFDISPLGWTVVVADLRSAFFASVDAIERIHLLVLIVSLVVAMVFLSLFINHITRPVEHLTGTIGRIIATSDLSQRAEIEFPDEIGVLAHKFNKMISELQEHQRMLETSILAERKARLTVLARETETLDLLGRVSDFRDEETGAHLRRIGTLSALLSKLLGQSEEEQDLIRYSAPLHDIGKIGIPDSILQKSGTLTDEEFERMKSHTRLGHDILAAARSHYLVEAATIALSHHERWDGSGYPEGLAGKAIPLSGRIVSIVDVFDALTSERRYKKPWSPERALRYIVTQSGTQFDPELVEVFKRNFEAFRECLNALGPERGGTDD